MSCEAKHALDAKPVPSISNGPITDDHRKTETTKISIER